MTNKNPFSGLLVAEIAAALAPLQAALTNISTGDGSLTSVTGALIELRGEFVAALPTLQKIGVATLASDLNQVITDWLAQQADAANPPVAEKAAAESKSEA